MGFKLIISLFCTMILQDQLVLGIGLKPSHERGAHPRMPPRGVMMKQGSAPWLVYNGGPIITKKFNVTMIYYNKDIPATTQTALNDYVSNLGSTSWAKVLNQYYDNTGTYINGANIVFGGAVVQPDPSAPCANTLQSCTITDAQIQAFVTKYDAAHLANQPDLSQHYAVVFDKYVSIVSGTDSSCQAFCGYHNSVQSSVTGKSYTYSVYAAPDACGGSCGSTSTLVADYESIISHEIAETMTDAEPDYWLGWYDDTNGEIGDICAWQMDTVSAANGKSYTVQKIWSNDANDCVSA